MEIGRRPRHSASGPSICSIPRRPDYPDAATQRKAILNDLINLADNERLQFSGEFADPERLLVAGEKTGLEGTSRSGANRLSIRQDAGLAQDQRR